MAKKNNNIYIYTYLHSKQNEKNTLYNFIMYKQKKI